MEPTLLCFVFRYSYANKFNKKAKGEYVWRVESHPNQNVIIPLSYKKPKTEKKLAGVSKSVEEPDNPKTATLPVKEKSNQPKLPSKLPKRKKKKNVKATKVGFH